MFSFTLQALVFTPLLIAMMARPTASLQIRSITEQRPAIALKFLQFLNYKHFQTQACQQVTDTLTTPRQRH